MAFEKRICPGCKEERWMFDNENLCMCCIEAQHEKRLDEMYKDQIYKNQIANGATEFIGEDTIRCPRCGERQCDDTVLYGDPSYLQCQSCHQKFVVNVETYYTYNTTRGWERWEEEEE